MKQKSREEAFVESVGGLKVLKRALKKGSDSLATMSEKLTDMSADLKVANDSLAESKEIATNVSNELKEANEKLSSNVRQRRSGSMFTESSRVDSPKTSTTANKPQGLLQSLIR